MNLFSYIDKYGCYTFDEVPFTEVDNVILSALSYLDLEKFVSKYRFNSKKIRVIGEEFFSKYEKQKNNMIAVKSAIKVFESIYITKRYENLLLYNYIYKHNGENQFCALTIEINKKLVFVSFEGTDHLISGWKEDFMMMYKFPVLAQKMAIDYVNNNFWFRNKKIILGGHSKGGNLAMVAGMYANVFVKNKIINIYNNDGPGLMLKQFDSKEYSSIESKLIHIVPNYSFFGLLLNHTDKLEVISSYRKSFYSHDFNTWVVEDNKFKRSELSSFSKNVDRAFLDFVKKYNEEEREKYIKELFEVFERANIDNLIDIFDKKRLIFKVLSESKDLDDNTKVFIKELVMVILDSFKSATREELKNIFNRK